VAGKDCALVARGALACLICSNRSGCHSQGRWREQGPGLPNPLPFPALSRRTRSAHFRPEGFSAVSKLVGALHLILVLLFMVGCAPGPRPLAPPSPAEIPTLQSQLAESPGDAGLLLRLGAAYREADRLDEARASLLDARARSPRDPGVLFYLGLTHEEMEEWAEAREAYQEFLEVEADAALQARVRDRLPLIRRSQLMADARQALEREAELTGQEPAPGTIAVFPFRYEGADPALEPLGRALAELTVSDLSRVGRLSVLERLQVQALLDELQLAEDGLVDPSTAARSGRLLGAGQIVQGSVSDEGARVDVLAAVVPSATGEVGDPVNEVDDLERIYELQRRMVLSLHAAMGIQLTDAERDRVMERPTRSLRALLLLGQALAAEDRGDYEIAADLFDEVLDEEPGFEEAESGRDRSRGAVDAEGLDVSELASEGQPQIPPGPGPVFDPRDGFRDVEAIIPSPMGRDPSAELLDNEGISASPAVIEIILRPPGGGQ